MRAGRGIHHQLIQRATLTSTSMTGLLVLAAQKQERCSILKTACLGALLNRMSSGANREQHVLEDLCQTSVSFSVLSSKAVVVSPERSL